MNNNQVEEIVQAAKLKIRSSNNSSRSNSEQSTPIPECILNLIARVFKKRAFEFEDDLSLSKTNYEHFLTQLMITCHSYGSLLNMLKHNQFPCQKCIENHILTFESKFKFNYNDQLETRLKAELMKKEIETLKSIQSFTYCAVCEQKNNKIRAQKSSQDFLKRDKERIRQLILMSDVRKQKSVSMRASVTIYSEIEVQRNYLTQTLLFLERKLLADNIFKIHFARKNQTVEILMSKQNLKCNLKLNELLAIDRCRENSLFKVAKTALKCHHSLYSYNVT